MRLLVIGSGGREHALCWKLAQSPGVELFASPGNPGIAQIATCVPSAQATDSGTDSGTDFGIDLEPDLTVVGPEVPLVDGIVDRFRARNLKIVGPSREAARLEGSKAYSK